MVYLDRQTDTLLTLMFSLETSHSNLADSFSLTSTSWSGFENSTRGAADRQNEGLTGWLIHIHTKDRKYISTSLTFNAEETGGFEVFGITSVRPCVIQSAVMYDQRSLVAVDDHLILPGLADLLSVPEPLYLCVLSGNFTLECGGGFLLHRLILQRLCELHRRLWIKTHGTVRASSFVWEKPSVKPPLGI